MTFPDWLKAHGYGDETALTARDRKHLELAWRAETQAPPVATVVTPPTPPTPVPPGSEAGDYDAELQAARRESARQTRLREITGDAIRASLNSPSRVERFHNLCQTAIAQRWDVQRFQLEMVREERDIGPIISVHRGDDITDDTLEAAICLSNKLPGVETKYSDQVLQAAHTRFKRGLGANELLVLAAEQNSGYRGSRRDLPALCKAAFPRHGNRDDDRYSVSAIGPSTISVPGILSNAANKFLETGFLFVEQSWRPMSKIRPANDFKEITIYRLTGSNKFEKVGPGGEIKHGTLGELAYGVKADIYGKVLGISEQDWRNDDLSAFTGAADELGRGAGDSLNEVWFTEFLADSAFFNTDKSKLNYDDGAVDSVLSLAGLENADAIFAAQTKPDGTPFGLVPKILFVPRGLRARAWNLMASPQVVGQGANDVPVPAGNSFSGMFDVVSSLYLGYTSLGGSTTAWYLAADPAAAAVMNVCFLDGVETPVVETGEFDFDRLGLAMRSTMRWGCRKAEYRGAVKLKGAA